jgi:hypothetical protein
MPETTLAAEREFDAGAATCGDFLLTMWVFLRKEPPGRLVRVRATGEEAGREIAAWCRVTGHILVDEAPPFYWIRIKPAH